MGTDADAPGSHGLQFEQAEYDEGPPSIVCSHCSTAIADSYYHLGSKMLCGRCRFDWELRQRAAPSGGLARVVRAVLAGGLAAALGSGLWFGVRWVTGGWEFGLLAIVVGLMVGAAVRWGSGGRGGRGYQLLAVFLTYNAIVVTYIPSIIEAIRQAPSKADRSESSATQPAEMAATGETVAAAQDAVPSADALPVSDATSASEGRPAAGSDAGLFSPVLALVALAFLLAVAYVAPFLAVMGDISAALGLVIIGIGLWEAWKINRRRTDTITGPFRVGAVVKSDGQP